VKGDDKNGFGQTDATEIVEYVDASNEYVYVGVKGKLPTGDDNGIGLWLNVTGEGAPSGRAAGTALAVSGGGHYLSGNGGSNPDFKADFEVDAMYALNTGGTSSDVYFDAASVTGGSASTAYVGSSDQSGTLASGTGPGGETIEFAVDNSGTGDTGIELKIPFAEIDATSDMEIQLFAMVVSGSAYFSNETVPGTVESGNPGLDDNGNPGFDANFNSLSTGPFHSSGTPLPVELASFDARRDGENVVLNWKTASETNNAGFAVQHAVGSGDFEQIGWVKGAGTTTEAQTYRFTAEDLSAGPHRFRLKQEDLDGTSSLSEVVEVNVRPDGPVAIRGVAPNPVRGTATLRFTARESGNVTVSLYDVLGRKVETLHQGRVSGGQPAQVTLNASSLSSGIYFLRVEGRSFTRTKRITVAQ
jgi:hypothetical protein